MARILSILYPEAAEMTVKVLDQGSLIVLPTDTVYGIGARISANAIACIFAAKERAPDRAVPVLLADIDAVQQVAAEFPDAARRLAKKFWPGPLTIALPKRDDLPSNLTMLPTVGVRVPDHRRTREILAAAGGALAVTSANHSSKPSACTIMEAIAYFKDRVALYLEGGTCAGGIPSTVVTFNDDGTLRVLREGPINTEALHAALA